MNKECGLLVNSSRGIIYAANDETFAQTAAEKAKELMEQMDAFIGVRGEDNLTEQYDVLYMDKIAYFCKIDIGNGSKMNNNGRN